MINLLEPTCIPHAKQGVTIKKFYLKKKHKMNNYSLGVVLRVV